MSDIAKLEKDILANVAAAKDEAALEAVRIAALGKNGSVSALLKTLGTMSADERKTQGPAINGLKDRVSESIAQRKDGLGAAALGGLALGLRLRRGGCGAVAGLVGLGLAGAACLHRFLSSGPLGVGRF